MQVVCPQNATKAGCNVYWTGSDVSSLYSQAMGSLGGRRLQSTRRMLDCSGSTGAGESALDLGHISCLLAQGIFLNQSGLTEVVSM